MPAVPTPSMPTPSRTSGIIGLAAVIVGVIAMGWALVVGVGVALQGGGSAALPYEITFFVGLALVVGAIALSIANVVRKRSVLLAIFTIAIGAVPVLTIIGGLLFASLGSQPIN